MNLPLENILLNSDGGKSGSNFLLIFQEIHLVVGHIELFLQSSEFDRPGIHLLPNSLLNNNLRLHQKHSVTDFLLLIDQTSNNIPSEFMN